MSDDPQTKKALEEGEHDYIWTGVFDGLVGAFTGVFNTRIGLGFFLLLLGIFMMFARVAEDDPGGLVTIRTVGILFLIASVLLFRSGIREKRRERESAEGSPKTPVRRATSRRRR